MFEYIRNENIRRILIEFCERLYVSADLCVYVQQTYIQSVIHTVYLLTRMGWLNVCRLNGTEPYILMGGGLVVGGG
jgi:hypothetical protein